MTFKIVTDSTCDLSPEYCQKSDITVLGLTITVDGVAFQTVGENALSSTELLKKMTKGAEVSTAALSSGEFRESFMKLADDGSEVLCLAFSSGLSGTYQAAVIARNMLLEENPDLKITVLDTLAAASGEGYLVKEAIKLRDSGKSLSETIDVLNHLLKCLRSWFMVDDLKHLARGGRIPRATALLGTIASVKPILNVDTEGKLRQVSKVRGTKKAINALVEETLKNLDENYPQVIVAHSDAEEAAENIKKQILSINSKLSVNIRPLGPVISVHTGAGTLAIFTIGENERE